MVHASNYSHTGTIQHCFISKQKDELYPSYALTWSASKHFRSGPWSKSLVTKSSGKQPPWSDAFFCSSGFAESFSRALKQRNQHFTACRIAGFKTQSAYHTAGAFYVCFYKQQWWQHHCGTLLNCLLVLLPFMRTLTLQYAFLTCWKLSVLLSNLKDMTFSYNCY